jgi:hypothetical protein
MKFNDLAIANTVEEANEQGRVTRLSKDGGLHWRGHQQWGHRPHDVHHHVRHVSNAGNGDDSSRVNTKEK